MSRLAKNKIITPNLTAVFERRRIISPVMDLLRTEEVRNDIQRLRHRGKYQSLGRVPCQQCKALDLTMMISERWMQAHLLNHRILRALGEERVWVSRMAQKRAENEPTRRNDLERGRITRGLKCKRNSEWLWLHTVLNMREPQCRQLAWVTAKLLGPIIVLSGQHHAIDHAARVPHTMTRPLAYTLERFAPCRVAFTRLLSVEERAILKTSYILQGVQAKRIAGVAASPIAFHVYTQRCSVGNGACR